MGSGVYQAALLAVVLVVAAILVLRGWGARKKREQIRIYILFSQVPAFNPKELSELLWRRWGSESTCRERKVPSDLATKTYLVHNEGHTLTLNVSSQPLPGEMAPLIAAVPPSRLSEEEVQRLKSHTAHVLISYRGGPGAANERILATAQVLLALLRLDGAVGLSNVPAQSYIPAGRLPEGARVKKELDASDLYNLFANTELVNNGEELWLHTHGMAQFYLPDLEVRFQDKERLGYYEALLGNAAVYMIGNRVTMKPGETARLPGDDTLYQVVAGEADESQRCGVIGLARV